MAPPKPKPRTELARAAAAAEKWVDAPGLSTRQYEAAKRNLAYIQSRLAETGGEWTDRERKIGADWRATRKPGERQPVSVPKPKASQYKPGDPEWSSDATLSDAEVARASKAFTGAKKYRVPTLLKELKRQGFAPPETPEQFQAQANQLAKKLGTSQRASVTAALKHPFDVEGNTDLIGSRAARDLRDRARSAQPPPPPKPGALTRATQVGGDWLIPERVERAAMGIPFSGSRAVQDLKELTAGFAMAPAAIAETIYGDLNNGTFNTGKMAWEMGKGYYQALERAAPGLDLETLGRAALDPEHGLDIIKEDIKQAGREWTEHPFSTLVNVAPAVGAGLRLAELPRLAKNIARANPGMTKTALARAVRAESYRPGIGAILKEQGKGGWEGGIPKRMLTGKLLDEEGKTLGTFQAPARPWSRGAMGRTFQKGHDKFSRGEYGPLFQPKGPVLGRFTETRRAATALRKKRTIQWERDRVAALAQMAPIQKYIREAGLTDKVRNTLQNRLDENQARISETFYGPQGPPGHVEETLKAVVADLKDLAHNGGLDIPTEQLNRIDKALDATDRSMARQGIAVDTRQGKWADARNMMRDAGYPEPLIEDYTEMMAAVARAWSRRRPGRNASDWIDSKEGRNIASFVHGDPDAPGVAGEIAVAAQTLYQKAFPGEPFPDIQFPEAQTEAHFAAKTRKRTKASATGIPETKKLFTEWGDELVQVAGEVTPEEWVQRVRAVVPDAKARDDLARWYEHYIPMFRRAFGEHANAVMRGFAVSQANDSPTGGLNAVLKIMDLLEEGKEIPLTAKGKPGISVVSPAIKAAVENGVIDKFVAAKLSDFADSLEGKSTRRWMGDHPDGGSPAAIDVHAIRDRGFIDKKIRAKIEKLGFVLGRDFKIEGSGSATGGKYERIAEWYGDIADHLNSLDDGKGFDGRADWTPAQAQALGWSTIQMLHGVLPEGFAEAFANNSRTLDFEMTRGPGALGNDLTLEQSQAVAARMVDAAKELGDSIPNIYVQRVEVGSGGWEQGVNGTLRVTVIGTKEKVQEALTTFARAFDQEWVQATREVSGKDSRATLVISTPKFSDVAQKEAFFTALNRINKHKQLQGYMDYDVDGTPGIAIRTGSSSVSPKTQAAFINRFKAQVAQAEQEVGITVDLQARNIEMITGGQHGAVAPVQTLAGTTRGIERSALDDPLEARIRGQLEAEVDRARGGPDPRNAPAAKWERILLGVAEARGYLGKNGRVLKDSLKDAERHIDWFIKEHPNHPAVKEIEALRDAVWAERRAGEPTLDDIFGPERAQPEVIPARVAEQMEGRPGKIYHGTSRKGRESILHERRVRVGTRSDPNAAWFSTSPKAAAFHGREVLEFPDTILPEEIRTPKNSFGAIGSKEDIFFQATEGEKRGAVRFLDSTSGRQILYMTDKADASTFGHEMFGHAAHEMKMELGDEFAKVERLYRKRYEDWTEVEHERFARDMEKYLMSGKAPIPELRPVFLRAKRWMKTVYETIKTLGRPIHPETRQLFDRYFGKEPLDFTPPARLRRTGKNAFPPTDDIAAIGSFLSETSGLLDRGADVLRNDPATIQKIAGNMKWIEQQVLPYVGEMDSALSERVHNLFKQFEDVKRGGSIFTPDQAAAIELHGKLLDHRYKELDKMSSELHSQPDHAVIQMGEDVQDALDHAETLEDLETAVKELREVGYEHGMRTRFSNERQKLLSREVRHLERALSGDRTVSKAERDAAQEAVRDISGHMKEILLAAYGEGLSPEAFAALKASLDRRDNILNQRLIERGLLPEGQGSGTYIPHYSIFDTLFDNLRGAVRLPAAGRNKHQLSMKVRADRTTFGKGLNKLVRYQTGDIKADPRALLSAYRQRLRFVETSLLRKQLNEIAVEIPRDHAGNPRIPEGWYIIKGEGAAIHPRLAKAAEMSAKEFDDLVGAGEDFESLLDTEAGFSKTLEEYKDSFLGKKGEGIPKDWNHKGLKMLPPEVVETMVGKVFESTPGGTFQSLGGLLSLGGRVATIFSHPLGYVQANVAANAIMLGLSNPSRMPRSVMEFLKTPGSLRKTDPHTYQRIATEVGDPAAQAGIPNFYVRAQTGLENTERTATDLSRRYAEHLGNIADQPFRVAAWTGEARKYGFTDPEGWIKLLDAEPGTETAHIRDVIAQRSRENMLDFNKLAPQEQVMARYLFIWPFIRAGTAWPLWMLREYPARMAAMSQLAGAQTAAYEGTGKKSVEQRYNEISPAGDRSMFDVNQVPVGGGSVNMGPVNPISPLTEKLTDLNKVLHGDPKPIGDIWNPAFTSILQGIYGGRGWQWDKIAESTVPGAKYYTAFRDPKSRGAQVYTDRDSFIDYLRRREGRFFPEQIDPEKIREAGKKERDEADKRPTWEKNHDQDLADYDKIIAANVKRGHRPPTEEEAAAIKRSMNAYNALDQAEAGMKRELGVTDLSEYDKVVATYAVVREYYPEHMDEWPPLDEVESWPAKSREKNVNDQHTLRMKMREKIQGKRSKIISLGRDLGVVE